MNAWVSARIIIIKASLLSDLLLCQRKWSPVQQFGIANLSFWIYCSVWLCFFFICKWWSVFLSWKVKMRLKVSTFLPVNMLQFRLFWHCGVNGCPNLGKFIVLCSTSPTLKISCNENLSKFFWEGILPEKCYGCDYMKTAWNKVFLFPPLQWATQRLQAPVSSEELVNNWLNMRELIAFSLSYFLNCF